VIKEVATAGKKAVPIRTATYQKLPNDGLVHSNKLSVFIKILCL